MELVHSFLNWFWNREIWLMPGVSWEDLKPTKENGFPDSKLLLPMMFYMTVFFLVLRYLIFEPLIIRPFGRSLGIKDVTCKKPPYFKKVEEFYQRYKKKKFSHNEIKDLAQQMGWSERQVERWIRHKTVSERPSKMFKFCDCSWNLIYYVFYCIYGFYALYDKPWLWDIKECWPKYPFQAVDNDVWWYYIISLGYYTTMSLTHMFQHKRKDSIQMLIHHIITMSLIGFSVVVNMIRLGSLILLVHECADIPLLLAKICGYGGYNSIMDFLFIVFILLWMFTRLYLFPFWIMKNSMFEAHLILNSMAPVYYIFNGMLVILLVFHLVWTFCIVQIIVKKLRTKQVKDLRSDDEELSKEFTEDYTYNNSVENNDHKKVN